MKRKFCERTLEFLVNLFGESTPKGEFIVARRVHHDCMVTVCSHDKLVDPIELKMVDVDIIMGMNWLVSCYATVNCRPKKVYSIFHKNMFLGGRVIWGH